MLMRVLQQEGASDGAGEKGDHAGAAPLCRPEETGSRVLVEVVWDS